MMKEFSESNQIFFSHLFYRKEVNAYEIKNKNYQQKKRKRKKNFKGN